MGASKIKAIVAAVFIAACVAGLVALRAAFVYAVPLSELSTDPEAHLGRDLRIQGKVSAEGPVKRVEGNRPYYEFVVEGESSQVKIRYDKVLPDTLLPGADATVEGRLTKPGYFTASKVLAKCPSKYDTKTVPASYRPPVTHSGPQPAGEAPARGRGAERTAGSGGSRLSPGPESRK